MSLQQYRAQIDEIDKELIAILARRNNLVKQFALYKKHQQMPPFDMKRWKELLRTRTVLAYELNLNVPHFKKIYMSILRMALEVEREI